MSDPSMPSPSPPELAQSSPRISDPQSGRIAVFTALAYLAFWQIAPRVRVDTIWAVLASTVVSLGLVIWFTALLGRALNTKRALMINLIASILLIVPLRLMFVVARPVPPWSLLLHVPGLPDLLFIWFGASIGVLLSFLLRGANMIPPVAAVLALVDIWTVLLGGPVKQIMSSPSPTAQAVTKAMTVELPMPKVGAAPFPLIVGFADFLFIAFFVAAICRFVPEAKTFSRTLRALIVVLCGYMILVLATGWSLPALLPMAVVMLALHWRCFRYSRNEVFALLYASLFIAAIIGAFWFFWNKTAPPKARANASQASTSFTT